MFGGNKRTPDRNAVNSEKAGFSSWPNESTMIAYEKLPVDFGCWSCRCRLQCLLTEWFCSGASSR